MRCDLVVGKVFPAPPHASPCSTCQREWTAGAPPTADLLTPTLIQIMPSRGLGDTVAKITHATGIDRAVKAVFGPDCGCAERQAAANKFFPYGKDQSNPK